MSRAAASEFPALSHAFNGYLHEDFVVQYGTPEAALQAFREDASPAEWRRVQREATRLLKLASTGEFDDVCALIKKLGSRWIPPSREALIALLTGLR
jgi:hypothetical protein